MAEKEEFNKAIDHKLYPRNPNAIDSKLAEFMQTLSPRLWTPAPVI